MVHGMGRLSASAFFGHKLRERAGTRLIFTGLLSCLFYTTYQKFRAHWASFGHQNFTWSSTVKFFKMAFPKILDFSAGSKFGIKLPQDIRYDRKSQNCDWVFFLLPLVKSRGQPSPNTDCLTLTPSDILSPTHPYPSTSPPLNTLSLKHPIP